jgi:N-acetylmuramoyl-L-alanine amidase
MPAVLLECLFIDTSTDAEKLADESFLQGLANEMAYGLARVLNLV